MLKSGTIEAKQHFVDTKVIYETERFEIIAQKIMKAFDIGDMVKLYGIQKVEFDAKQRIWQPPEDVSCEIIGKGRGRFVICYPKGHLVVEYIKRYYKGSREFKWEIGKNEQGKHYYQIWRSK